MSTLYRYYDHDGKLLYVGQTGQGRQRASSHARDASWWHLVHFAEFHEVRGGINLAERLAIWVEQPLYNVMGRTSTAKRQEMLGRLAEVEHGWQRYGIGEVTASRILGLDVDDIGAAVRWGFLECDYPRKLEFTPDQLRRFIGEKDRGRVDIRGHVGYFLDDMRGRLHPEMLRGLDRHG